MKKLIIAYLFTITNVFAAPPTYFNGELQTNTYIQNIKAPNYQTTPLGGIDRRLETGNLNELQNPSFEHTTVTTGWTVSNATSSSSTTRIEGSKSLSLALTGALSLSQSSTINAAQKSGVQMVASIWVNSSDVSDLQLCSLKNGSEDKCTVTGGYVQGSGWRQLTVSFLGDSASNGLKLKSTDTTGTVLVDQAYVGIGSPVVDFTPDMVYSAKISAAGVVSDENTDFINGNCTVTSTSQYACSYISNLGLSSPMNCVAMTKQTSQVLTAQEVSNTTTGFTYKTVTTATTTNFAESVNLICEKTGADYKTSKAYVASSSGAIFSYAYGTPAAWLANAPIIYPTIAYNLGGAYNPSTGEFTVPRDGYYQATVFNQSNNAPYELYLSRNGGGTVGVNAVNIASSATATDNKKSGSGVLFANKGDVLTIRQSTSTGTTGQGSVSFTYIADVNGVIVGSFQGYNETPGTSRVETFSVSYGTTNATTVCSASPCSYLDQIGNAVTSVTRSGVGQYAINLSKTYAKLKCSGNTGNGLELQFPNNACSSCSSLAFQTDNFSTASNSYGTLICQGIPQ